jgi:Glycosyltransferase 61
MKQKYKLLFFLKYRLKLNLFKKFESKFVEKLIPAFEIVHSPRFNVSIKYLIFDINKNNSSFLEKSRIIFDILRTRALTRTLIFGMQAMPNSNEVYKISRWKLGMELLKNRKLLTRNIVSHLSYGYLSFKDYSGMKLLSPLHIGHKDMAKDLIEYQIYLIEETYSRKKYLKIIPSDKIRQSVLDRFISWNTNIFIEFAKSNKLDKITNEYLRSNYYLLFVELNKYIRLEYVNHELSYFSLDYLLQKNGLDSFETILDGEILHQRFISVKNRIINFDATMFPTQKFIAGVWPFSYRDKKNLGIQQLLAPSQTSVDLSEAIFLIGRCDENWYHFLLDTVPRLLFFENIPAHVPILIRSDLPSTTKEFLRKLTSRNVIEVMPEETFKVSKLYVCPGRSTVFDSTPPNGLSWVEFSPLVLNLFRRKVLDSLGVSSDSHKQSRITFERNSATRNNLNPSSTKRVLQDFTFQTLPLNVKFFQEQVQVFHNANFVVAPGGAVLANIIFMKPGTKVLVLISWRNRKLKLWKDLSESFNLKYMEVKGFPIYWGFNYLQRMHSNYYISLRKLRRILSKEI